MTCRVLTVSTSGFYEWSSRRPPARGVADAVLLDQIIEVHAAARATYGIDASALNSSWADASRWAGEGWPG